jgi:hypothetical protein
LATYWKPYLNMANSDAFFSSKYGNIDTFLSHIDTYRLLLFCLRNAKN